MPRLPVLHPFRLAGLPLPRERLSIGPGRQRRQLPQLSPEQKIGLLRRIGATGLSGLVRVGQVLDTPWSVGRGLLAGEPERALSGILDPSQRVYGRELLEKWDVLGPNKEGFDWGDVAGFAVEVADPFLLPLTLGAKGAISPMGALAKRAGLFPMVRYAARAKKLGVLDDAARVFQQVTTGGQRMPLPGWREAKQILNFDELTRYAKTAARAKAETGIMPALKSIPDVLSGSPLVRSAELGTSPAARAQTELMVKAIAQAKAAAKLKGTAAAQEITGAITRAARKMGIGDLTRLQSQPLGGLATYGVPGVPTMKLTLGTGPAAQRVARALDKLGAGIKFSPVGRYLQGRFNPAFRGKAIGTPTRAELELAEQLQHVASISAPKAKAPIARAAMKLQRLAGDEFDPTDVGLARRMADRIIQTTNATQDDALEIYDAVAEHYPEFLLRAKQMGVPANDLVDKALENAGGRYWARYESFMPGGKVAKRGRLIIDPSSQPRAELFKEVAGGTEPLRALIRDPELNAMIDAGESLDDIAAKVTELGQRHGVPDTYLKYVEGKWQEATGRYGELADYLMNKSPELRAVGLWGNHPLEDAAVRFMTGYMAPDAAAGFYDQLADAALRGTHGETTTIGKVLKQAGLIQGDDLSEGAIGRLAERMAPGADFTSAKRLLSRPVSKDVATGLVHQFKAYMRGEATDVAIEVLDDFTNLFKAGVTSVAPAFHTRNRGSGAIRAWMEGLWSPKANHASHQLTRGQIVTRSLDVPIVRAIIRQRGLAETPENGTYILQELAHAHGVAGYGAGEQAVRVGAGAETLGAGFQGILERIPGAGSRPMGAKRIFRELFGLEGGATWNPLKAKARGVLGAPHSTFAPLVAGESLGEYVEHMNRLTPFLYQLFDGVDPLAAADRVLSAQVRYGKHAMTAFERNWMKRLFPFYTFHRQNIPWTISHLASHPGGRMAQVIRGISKMRDPNAVVPPHISQTSAIPIDERTPILGPLLAPQAGADPRYLTGLGMMFESALPLIAPPGEMASEILSQGNPLWRTPIEMVTGKSFFQRGPMGPRDVRDMDPAVARLIANVTPLEPEQVPVPQWAEQAIMGSPVARGITTARTLTDPRKRAWGYLPGPAALTNVLTGWRFTDLPQASQDRLMRDFIYREIIDKPGGRMFQKAYFPADEIARMSPEERARAAELMAMLRVLRARGQQRAAAR